MTANTTDNNTTEVDVILAAEDGNNTTAASCDCSAPASSSNTTSEEPEAVLKVFTLDWKVKDVVDLMGPRFEEHKNGRVKIDVSVVTGFDTLFSEIENDARLGLGLFDVCECIIYYISCLIFLSWVRLLFAVSSPFFHAHFIICNHIFLLL